GPIERAGHLLPQLAASRLFRMDRDHFWAGVWLVIWGLGKKMVLADNLGLAADPVFDDPHAYPPIELLIATLAFTFQIFFDFSAYSDIARGAASFFGIKLVRNFRLPYLASSPSDFWRRWHVSLSEWIRDYVYVPLGGDRGGRSRTLVNLTITMALAGLWHGAAWHFCVWGLYHGLLLVVWRMTSGAFARRLGAGLVARLRPLRQVLMFGLVVIGWVFFRADSLPDAAYILESIASLIHPLATAGFRDTRAIVFFGFVAITLVAMELEERRRILTSLTSRPIPFGILLAVCILAILILAPEETQEFIYFQF
ncbi:MAG: MBOAT family protein, partial [Planctomycetes bacterium]|nr:MBOAT family protein [Planctomycetota bacterium]